jgi:protein pelota
VYRHALKEVLSDPSVASRLSNTKASGEVKVLNDFYEMLKNEPDRAFYGLKHIKCANDRLAIQVLMITDELFRYA